MYELRVLSGLHRGATLPIDGRPHTIGASEDADVVLVDPGIVEQHASLTLNGANWSLSSLDGGVLDAQSNRPQAFVDLVPGEFARVGNVWLTVVTPDAPWDNPPPEPDDNAGAARDDVISVSELNAEAAEGQLNVDAGVIAAAEQPVVMTKGSGKNSRRVIYISMAVATVLSAAAYAITSRPEPAERKFDVRAQFEAMAKKDAKKGERLDAPLAEGEASAGDDKKLSMDELRQSFRKRLSDADLMKRFDLDLGDKEWSMKAALDDEEAARFERILASFVKANNVSFPINAKVGSAEAMLPFKIRQVTTGVNASVVTQDGTRLYIGEEYKGVKLASIQDSRVTFTGKRKIEVKW
jgi:type III secretion protein D